MRGITLADLEAKGMTILHSAGVSLVKAAGVNATVTESNLPLVVASEAEFQREVVTFAQSRGWIVAHFRPSLNSRGEWQTAVAADGEGFPDLVMVRDRIIWAELKNRTNLSENQKRWRDAIQKAGGEWYLWRPKHWDELKKVLR